MESATRSEREPCRRPRRSPRSDPLARKGGWRLAKAVASPLHRPFGRAQPDADRCRRQAAADDRTKVAAESLEIDLVPKLCSEAIHGHLGVVARPVESPVHRLVNAPPQRL